MTQKKTPFSIFWHKFKQRKTAMIAGLFVIILVLVAIFAPLVAPHDPFETDYNLSMMPPTLNHPAGTDVYGMTRIVGYFSRVNNWNKSKLGELKDRQKGQYKIA